MNSSITPQKERGARHAVTALAALALVCTSLSSRTAAAEPVEGVEALAAQLSGTYRYAGSVEQGKAIVDRAFEQAIENVIPLFRPFLRKQMEQRDYLPRSITIKATPDHISYRAKAYKVFAISSDPGELRTFRSNGGSEVQVTQQYRDGKFEQTLDHSKGRQQIVYTLFDGGRTLRVETTFTSRYLARPVSFELTYQRVGAAPRATAQAAAEPGPAPGPGRPPATVAQGQQPRQRLVVPTLLGESAQPRPAASPPQGRSTARDGVARDGVALDGTARARGRKL